MVNDVIVGALCIGFYAWGLHDGLCDKWRRAMEVARAKRRNQ